MILHAPVEVVAPRVPAWAGTVEPHGEDRTLLHTGSDWLDGLAVYIAHVGVDFTVLDPPELAERVRELAQRFARAGAASP